MDSKFSGHEAGRRRRRVRILESARAVLRAGEELTVERIARGAGVAPATVFNVVGPRDKIWSALIGDALEHLDDMLGAMSDVPPFVRARRTVTGLAEVFVSDPQVYRLVASQWGRLAVHLGRGPLDRIHRALADAVAAGVLRPDADVDRLAGAIQTSCVGALHQWGAGLIDDAGFRDRCALGVDLAFAAAATDAARAELNAAVDR